MKLYTITMVFFAIICIIYVYKNRKNMNWLAFNVAVWTNCFLAWMEFYKYKVWEFSPEQILGVYIAGIAIEDIVFAPVLSIMFYAIWEFLDKRINYESSPIGKLISLIGLSLVTMFFYINGGVFAHYLCVRMLIGIGCLIVCFKMWDLKLFWVMFIGCLIPTMLWEIWAGNTLPPQWAYIKGHPMLSNWGWFQIGRAWFNFEIFPWYYESGIGYVNGMCLLITKFFPKKIRIKDVLR